MFNILSMFNIETIKSELVGLVGFRNPANPKYAIVDNDNQKSESGLFINDNPYSKIEYLKDNHDYSRITDDKFNSFLKNLKSTSCVDVCFSVFNKPDFIDRNLIYSMNNNKVDEITLPIGFVGYKIDVSNEKDVAFSLNKGIFEFTVQTEIQFLVLNSNNKEPIFAKTITCNEFYHEETLNFVCNNSGYYKGSFFVGFVVTNQKTYDRNYNSSNYMNKLTYLDINQIYVDDTSATMFNQNNIEFTNKYCGFNLDITVVDDYTNLILANKYLFSRAIYLNAVISCLNIYVSSLRSNSSERDSNELYSRIMLEIEGTRPDDNVVHIRGLRPEMVYEISQIRNELLKLNNSFFGIGYNVDTQN